MHDREEIRYTMQDDSHLNALLSCETWMAINKGRYQTRTSHWPFRDDKGLIDGIVIKVGES